MIQGNTAFLQFLKSEAEGNMSKFGLNNIGPGFMMWYAIEALRLTEDDALLAVRADGGNDNGIDLFHIDDDSEVIIIAQGKFQTNGLYNARYETLLGLIHSTDSFNPETMKRNGRMDLADMAVDYKDAIDKGYSVDYHFVFMGPKKPDVSDRANAYNSDFEGSPGRSAHAIDLEQLQRIHDEYIDIDSRIHSETIRLSGKTVFEQNGTYGKSLVVTLSGSELKRLHDNYGPALFDRNVRLFLGARKGSVNYGIKETLSSEHERTNFWAYNNGITIVCDSFQYSADDEEVHLQNFSIVNGCQTTVSIATSGEIAAKDVNVLARFISVNNPQIVDEIIKYTNSQTKIRDWDLASQDRTQKALKKNLAMEPHPFFYQLRRGEWNHLDIEARSPFMRGNAAKIIEPDILAQRLSAFKGNPVPAYKEKGSLFTSHSRQIFPADQSVTEVLMAWQAGEAAEVTVTENIVKAKANDELQRVRILARGGKTFVTSLMAILLTERNGPQYIGRIKREVAGSRNTRRDLNTYAKVACSYYVEIMEDRLESGLDLNQMVRNEESFDQVRKRVRSKWERDSISSKFVGELPLIK